MFKFAGDQSSKVSVPVVSAQYFNLLSSAVVKGRAQWGKARNTKIVKFGYGDERAKAGLLRHWQQTSQALRLYIVIAKKNGTVTLTGTALLPPGRSAGRSAGLSRAWTC